MAKLTTKITTRKKKIGSIPEKLRFSSKRVRKIPSTSYKKLSPESRKIQVVQNKQRRSLTRLGVNLTSSGVQKPDWKWWQIPINPGLLINSKEFDKKNPNIDGTILGRNQSPWMYPLIALSLPYQFVVGTTKLLANNFSYGLKSNKKDDYKGEQVVRWLAALFGVKREYEGIKSILDVAGVDMKSSFMKDQINERKGETPFSFLESDYRGAGILYALGTWDSIEEYNKWYKELNGWGIAGVIISDIAFSIVLTLAAGPSMGNFLSLKPLFTLGKKALGEVAGKVGAKAVYNITRKKTLTFLNKKIASNTLFKKAVVTNFKEVSKKFRKKITNTIFLNKDINKVDDFFQSSFNKTKKGGFKYTKDFFKQDIKGNKLKSFEKDLWNYYKSKNKLNEVLDLDTLIQETGLRKGSQTKIDKLDFWEDNFIDAVMTTKQQEGIVSNFLYSFALTKQKIEDISGLFLYKLQNIFGWIPKSKKILMHDLNITQAMSQQMQEMKNLMLDAFSDSYMKLNKKIFDASKKIITKDATKLLREAIKTNNTTKLLRALNIQKTSELGKILSNKNTLKSVLNMFNTNKWTIKTTDQILKKNIMSYIDQKFEFAKVKNITTQYELLDSLRQNKKLILPYSKSNEAYVDALYSVLNKKLKGTSFKVGITTDPINFLEEGRRGVFDDIGGIEFSNIKKAVGNKVLGGKKFKSVGLFIYRQDTSIVNRSLTTSQLDDLIQTTLSSYNVDELMKLTTFGQYVSPLRNKELVEEGLKDLFLTNISDLQKKSSHGVQRVIGLFTHYNIPVNKAVIKKIFTRWRNILPDDKSVMSILNKSLKGGYQLDDIKSFIEFYNDLITTSIRSKITKSQLTKMSKKTILKIEAEKEKLIMDLADTFADEVDKLNKEFHLRSRKTFLGAYSKRIQTKINNMFDVSKEFRIRNKILGDGIIDKEATEFALNTQSLNEIMMPDGTKSFIDLPNYMKDRGYYFHVMKDKHSYEYLRMLDYYNSNTKLMPKNYKSYKDYINHNVFNQKEYKRLTQKHNPVFQHTKKSSFVSDFQYFTPQEVNSIFDSNLVMTNPMELINFKSGQALENLRIVKVAEAVFKEADVKLANKLFLTKNIIDKRGVPITGINKSGVSKILPDGDIIINVNAPDVKPYFDNLLNYKMINMKTGKIQANKLNKLLSDVSSPLRDDPFSFVYTRYTPEQTLSLRWGSYSRKILKNINDKNIKGIINNIDNLINDVSRTSKPIRYYNSLKNLTSGKRSMAYKKNPELKNLYKEGKKLSEETVLIKKMENLKKELKFNIKNKKAIEAFADKNMFKSIINDAKSKFDIKEGAFFDFDKELSLIDDNSIYLKKIFQEHTDVYGPKYSEEMIQEIRKRIGVEDVYIDNKKVSKTVSDFLQTTEFQTDTLDEITKKIYEFANNKKNPYIKMPATFFNQVKRVPPIQERGVIEQTMHGLTQNFFMKMWKGTALLSVGYHLRNVVSNMFQGYMAGVPLSYSSRSVLANSIKIVKAQKVLNKFMKELSKSTKTLLSKGKTTSLKEVMKGKNINKIVNNKTFAEFQKLNNAGLFSGDHFLSMSLKSMFNDLSKLNRISAKGLTNHFETVQRLKKTASKIFEVNMNVGKILDHSQKMATFNYIKGQTKNIFSLQNNKILFNNEKAYGFVIMGNVSDWKNVVRGINSNIKTYNTKILGLKNTLARTDDWIIQLNKKIATKRPELIAWIKKNNLSKRKALEKLELDKQLKLEKITELEKLGVSGFAKQQLNKVSESFAIRASISAHFNYSELSEFEKRYMKKIIPFYTWARKAFEYSINAGLKQTNRLHIADRSYRKMVDGIIKGRSYAPTHNIFGFMGEENTTKDRVPEWIVRDGRMPLTEKDGIMYYLKTELPHLSISRFLGFGSFNMFASVNPVFKLGIESLYGVNLYNGRRDDSSVADKAMNTLLFKGRFENIFKKKGRDFMQHSLEASGITGSYDINRLMRQKARQRIFENQKLITKFRKKGYKINSGF